jgi:transposase
LEILYEVAAGIDVHRDTLVVSIRKNDGRGQERVETRTFETFHDSLLEMNAWLDANDVPVVGLESTGVYWKPVVRVIQLVSPKRVVWLVNPAEVKRVPGRKTDKKDSRWISKLVMYGLVSPSFLPSPEQEELRKLTRYRYRLVSDKVSLKNRIIKELESAGIKLASVCSDVLGKSGRDMLDALLEGGKTPAEIADLARGRLRSKLGLLERAAHGSFSVTVRLILRQMLARLDDNAHDTEIIDDEIRNRLLPHMADVERLQSVPGLATTSIAAVIAEAGTDMSMFETSDHLTAWAGLSPGSNESAGKSKSTRARKGDKYLRTMLVQAAWAAVRTRATFWRYQFHRLAARLGPAKTIVAIARKMLVTIFYILRDSVTYKPPELAPPSPKAVRRLVERLAALGYQVSPPATAA